VTNEKLVGVFDLSFTERFELSEKKETKLDLVEATSLRFEFFNDIY